MFTKSKAKTKWVKSMVHYTPCSTNKPTDSKMSCFILSDKHPASIAKFVQSSLGWTEKQTQHLADKLKRCNLQSVNYSGSEKKPMDKCKIEDFKVLNDPAFYGAVRCWAYSSGLDLETPDFNELLAFLFSLVPDEFGIEKSIDNWIID